MNRNEIIIFLFTSKKSLNETSVHATGLGTENSGSKQKKKHTQQIIFALKAYFLIELVWRLWEKRNAE